MVVAYSQTDPDGTEDIAGTAFASQIHEVDVLRIAAVADDSGSARRMQASTCAGPAGSGVAAFAGAVACSARSHLG